MKNNLIFTPTALRMVGALLTIWGALAFAGCQPIKANNTKGLSICEIRGDRVTYVGKRVTLSLIYSFDGASHEMLIDKSCKDQNILNVTTTLGKGDETVREFFNSYEARCQASKNGERCRSDAEIEAEITIVQNEDRTLAGNMERILSYKSL